MSIKYKTNNFPDMTRELINWQRKQFGPYNGYHEAYGIIAEEFDEFWNIVKKKKGDRDANETLKELLDIAACCWKAAEDLGTVNVDSYTDEYRQEFHTKRQKDIESTLKRLYESIVSSHDLELVNVPSLQRGGKNRRAVVITQEFFQQIVNALDQ